MESRQSPPTILFTTGLLQHVRTGHRKQYTCATEKVGKVQKQKEQVEKQMKNDSVSTQKSS